MTSFQSYRDQRFPVSNIRLLETDGMSITWGTFHLTDELYIQKYPADTNNPENKYGSSEILCDDLIVESKKS